MIRVGTAGWSYPDWEGIVYPKAKPKGFHPLRYLAGFVDCMELNSSFYGLVRDGAADKWLDCVREKPDFRFAAKLHRSFTHETLPETDNDLESMAAGYSRGIEPLRAARKLSAVLVQFPLSFHWSPVAKRRLERLETCFGHYPLVLEVRHQSWFDKEPLKTVERLGFSLAHIDLPASKNHPPADAPSIGPLGYVRLHGRNKETWFARGAGRDQRYDYLYDKPELEEVVGLVKRLAEGVDETLVITNNHFSGKAVANALEIVAALKGEPPKAPTELVAKYPRLASVTKPQGQKPLFE